MLCISCPDSLNLCDSSPFLSLPSIRTFYSTHLAIHHYPNLTTAVGITHHTHSQFYHRSLLACLPLCFQSNSHSHKHKCTFLAFVMYLLRHHLVPFEQRYLTSPTKILEPDIKYEKVHLRQVLHSLRAREILLTKYENRGCPECVILSGCEFTRTSISALRRECNIWASSFLE